MTSRGAVLLGALLWLALFLSFAQAHHAPSGWRYPTGCCNLNDCRPMHSEEVVVTAKGYYLPEYGRFIPFSTANSSPDAEFHVCIDSREKVRSIHVDTEHEKRLMNRSSLCFWAPEHGS